VFHPDKKTTGLRGGTDGTYNIRNVYLKERISRRDRLQPFDDDDWATRLARTIDKHVTCSTQNTRGDQWDDNVTD